jgi:hypothetical protein
VKRAILQAAPDIEADLRMGAYSARTQPHRPWLPHGSMILACAGLPETA